jgi:chromosome segregation ATPase
VSPLSDRIDSAVAALQAAVASPIDVRPNLETMAATIAELRLEVAAGRNDEWAESHDARLARLASIAEQLQVGQPEVTLRLDQVQAELADLRTRSPDPTGVLAPVLERLEQVAAEVGRLQETQPALAHLTTQVAELRDSQPDPSAVQNFVAERLDRITAEVVAVRANQPSLVETTDAILQLETALAHTAMQVNDIAAAVTALRETPVDTSGALVPVVDRLAVVVDAVSAMQGDVSGLAEAISVLRADRSQLAQMTEETNSRLESVTSNLAELRDSRPDFTPSFAALTGLLESLQASVANAQDRIDFLAESIRGAGEDRGDLSVAVAPMTERLDRIATQVSATQQQMVGVIEGLDDAFRRIDSERAATIAAQMDDVRQSVSGLSERQATALAEVVSRFEQVSANAAATQQTARGIEAALQAQTLAADDTTGQRLGDLTEQVASLSSDVKSTVRALVGLGADVTGLRAELATMTASMPDRTEADAEARSALTRLDAAIADRDQQLRDTVARLDSAVGERDTQLREAIIRLDAAVSDRESDVTDSVARLDAALAERDANVRDVLARLDQAIARAVDESEVSALASQIDTAIADLRRDVQTINQLASRTDVLEAVRALGNRDPDEAARAVVASAASAMARLEGRIDGEFDTVSRQMEALGTLLGQVIDAVHRVEAQVVGVQPVSEKMRSAAASVLDSLRANVRQRAEKQNTPGPPPELGSGR